MSETLIKVEAVSKKFCRSLKKSLWYGMQDLGREITGRQHGGNGELRPDEFWAVKDVIAYLSQSVGVKAGDLIYTGTPAGVGALQRGDVVTGGIDGIAELSLPIG